MTFLTTTSTISTKPTKHSHVCRMIGEAFDGLP
jgi:hypothetical protein